MEHLGIVSYTNVAPLYWQLEPWPGCTFVYGVPTELNHQLLAGDIDLTLISSVEFIRQRHILRALPDFSISTLGAVRSVMLFHWRPWEELQGARIAITTHSATSVELLTLLLAKSRIDAELIPVKPDLTAMLVEYDAALLIGDAALIEASQPRAFQGRCPLITDLGEKWYEWTRLPFTFAVWASRHDNPPSQQMVTQLREARENGLGHLRAVSAHDANKLGLPTATVQTYLSHFRYYLERPDRDGLVQFATESDATFKRAELQFWDL